MKWVALAAFAAFLAFVYWLKKKERSEWSAQESDARIDEAPWARQPLSETFATNTSRPTPSAPGPRPPGSYRMGYVDFEGSETVRDISDPSPERVGRELYLEAWCHLRNERRTFKANRIRWLEAPSGERILAPVKHFTALAPIPMNETPEFIAHSKAMSRVLPSLRALIWIARTDRDIDTEEMAVLLDYIPARLRLAAGATAWSEHFARAWIDDANPIKADAVEALRALRQDSAQVALFQDFAWRIVTTGGDPDRLKENRRQQLLKMIH